MPHAFDLGPEAGSGSVPFHFGPFYFGAAMQASGHAGQQPCRPAAGIQLFLAQVAEAGFLNILKVAT